MLVQMVIHGAAVDVHVRVGLLDALHTLRRGQQNHQLDVFAAPLLHLGDGGLGAAAGGQHGIHDHDVPLRNVLGHLAEVDMVLTDPSEMDLIRMLAAFPQEIVMAAEKYDPSRINRFVIDLASAFHRFYGNCRIQGADPAVQQARLALCIGVKNVIFNVLTMFKINVPEKM